MHGLQHFWFMPWKACVIFPRFDFAQVSPPQDSQIPLKILDQGGNSPPEIFELALTLIGILLPPKIFNSLPKNQTKQGIPSLNFKAGANPDQKCRGISPSA